jgi:hypothetical protein
MSTLGRSKAYDAKLHPHQLGDRTIERVNSPTPHQASCCCVNSTCKDVHMPSISCCLHFLHSLTASFDSAHGI